MSGFIRHFGVAAVEMLPGVHRRTLGTTGQVMLCEITLEAGAVVPTHSHPHDQIGYVVSGTIRMTVAGQERLCGPGDGYVIPGGTPHAADAPFGRTVVIDVFNPPREEYRTAQPWDTGPRR